MLIPSEATNAEFFRYLFKSQPYIQALQATTNLVRDGQALRFSNFTQVDLPLMPLAEQSAIAAFLDHETGKIDALIAEQEKLLTLLAEKRQAAISHAVTRGLNPNAPMKDSGVPWLGEVPAHWIVSKCGRYLSILSGFAFPSAGFSREDGDTKLLRGVNVGVSKLRWDDVVYWQRSDGDGLDAYELGVGDLVIGMDRPLIADGMRVARVKEEDLPCLLLQRVASIKTGKVLRADFLRYLLASEMFVAHFSPETSGVSVPHISPDQIASFVIPLAPIEEQVSILFFLEIEISKLDALKFEAERAITLLKEHRSALIAAAVTGKIDVRQAA
jgi:type I restriction enzyme S subunit